MIRLETTNGEVLSKILKEVSPMRYRTNRQVNRLLDGTYHVQIIGSPLRSMDGTIISSYNQVEKLNELMNQGTPWFLLFETKKYLVYIDEPVDWEAYKFCSW